MKNSLIFTILSAICALQPCYMGAMQEVSAVARFNAIVELLGNDPNTFEQSGFSLEYIGLDKGLVGMAIELAQAKLNNNDLLLLKYEIDAQFIETIKIEIPECGYMDWHIKAAAKLFGKDRSLFKNKQVLLSRIGFDKKLIHDAMWKADELTLESIEKEYDIGGVPVQEERKLTDYSKLYPKYEPVKVKPQKTPEKKEAPKKQSFW